MDNLSPTQRVQAMRAVKSKDTSPELAVRRLCRELGETGYRLHRSDIPGSPDIAFLGKRRAIFVHGCFWHGHQCKAGAKTAKTNVSYWQQKIVRNMIRDRRNLDELERLGWHVFVAWECEIKDKTLMLQKLERFLLDCP